MKSDNIEKLDKEIKDYFETLPEDMLLSDLVKDERFRSLMDKRIKAEGALNEKDI